MEAKPLCCLINPSDLQWECSVHGFVCSDHITKWYQSSGETWLACSIVVKGFCTARFTCLKVLKSHDPWIMLAKSARGYPVT